MPLDLNKARKCLRAFDFSGLFTQELGWDWYTAETKITVAKSDLFLKGVAEKRGVHVFHCPPGADGRIPDAALCAAIERQVARIAREHLLIFTDAARTEQVWLYPRREPGKPIRLIRYRFEPGKANELLLQKLSAITFTLNEEEGLNLLGVVECLKDALDRDVVTKSFYQQFDRERLAFQKFLKGIPDEKLQRWYVAVLLNRLMFIYFIQQKGFLGGHDQRYLQNKLVACKGNYYRDFLCPLFFQGFALRPEDRPATINAMLGQVPYLNGGIFQRHQIEEAHGRTIEIANEAFRAMFAFFDRWRWHLDERPLAGGNEIDPSILGYIFERYINAIQPGEQKAKGAYYTKEDITGYIARNTIIPRLFDMAAEKCRTAFEGDASVWHLLALDPDRYIYAAVGHGVALPLPPEIEEGVDTKRSNLLERRAGWNKPAPSEYALPTEIWREVVARRQRYANVSSQLRTKNQELRTNDLITLNLDIVQFAQDVVENAEPDLLWAFYGALKTITVLDPTCGSGAFLFAAVNILEPLYSACLSRMETFLGDWERTGTRHTQYRKWFRKEFDAVRAHRNQNYFIFKTIILNNLYGVDIMDEAVEICKLRLFLKLAAQTAPDAAKPNIGIEPLPDIDFNIRPGNTLVGFASRAELEAVGAADWIHKQEVDRVLVEAEEAGSLYTRFQQCQIRGDDSPAEFKARLTKQFGDLRVECDAFVADLYEMGLSKKPKKLDDWLAAYTPFHWFVEFYGIMSAGGFDVIIGNPPYLEFKEVDYALKGYATLDTSAIHAACIERAARLLQASGCMSMIVPLALVSTQRMKTVQGLLEAKGTTWYANFAWRPGKLFDTVNRALTIFTVFRSSNRNTFTTGYQKWTSDTRQMLMPLLTYNPAPTERPAFWIPKFSNMLEASILKKMLAANVPLARHLSRHGSQVYYRTTGGLYWKVFTDFAPAFRANGRKGHSSRETSFCLADGFSPKTAVAVLSSDVFWWWYTITTNLRDLNPSDIQNFPVPPSCVVDPALEKLGIRYLDDLDQKSTMLVRNQKQTGKTETQSFKIQLSKPIVDEIDQVLAKHYRFTDEELDFIINYDIKYRMGRDRGEAEEE